MQAFGQRAGERGDHVIIGTQAPIGFFTAVPARERHNANDGGEVEQIAVQVGLFGEGEFEHDVFVIFQLRGVRFEFPQENIFDGSFVLGMDVDFRFDDGDKSCRNDLAGVVKLLFDDTADAVFVPFFDDGAHFRTEDMSFFSLAREGRRVLSSVSSAGHRRVLPRVLRRLSKSE